MDISEQPRPVRRARRVKFQGEQQEEQEQQRGRVVFAELNPAALTLEQKLTNSQSQTQVAKINLQSQEETGSHGNCQGQEEVESEDQSTNAMDIESSWDSDITQEATEKEEGEWENWEDQEFTVENLKSRWSKL